MKKFFNIRFVLFSMLFLLIVWLLGIWITRATDNWQKLLILGVVGVLGYLGVIYSGSSIPERVGAWIERWTENRNLFLISLFVLMLAGGVLYASVQREWPFDETMNYRASSLIIREGLDVFFEKYALNNYLSNRHPPLIFLINGLALFLFGNSLFTIRLVTLAFSFALMITCYLLASNLYDKKTGVLTVLFLITFPLIFRESTAGLLDVQGTLFYTLSLLLAWKLAQKPSGLLTIALGLSLGFGFLTKYILLFIVPVLLIFFFFWRNYRITLVPLFLSLTLAGGLLLLWAWYGSLIGVRLPEMAGFSPTDLFATQVASNSPPNPQGYIVEEIAISPGYFITSEWGRGFLLNSLLTKLPSGLGVYNLPLILLGLWRLVSRVPRKARDWYVLLWIGMTSLLLILTLPDHRYFMMIFPALAIAMAQWAATALSVREIGQVTLLGFIYQIGALYLMVDWSRTSELFVK